MSINITQYKVFFASPEGLRDERLAFRQTLTEFSEVYVSLGDAMFHPVGMDDVSAGVGRAQARTNKLLAECDYAFFVLHDRWGSDTGGGYSSGTYEEWEIAQRLYEEQKLKDIVLVFKDVVPAHLADPGPQLQQVLNFRQRIEQENKFTVKAFSESNEFRRILSLKLRDWMRIHVGNPKIISEFMSIQGPDSHTNRTLEKPVSAFSSWLAEARIHLSSEVADYEGAYFCATKAVAHSENDVDWAQATSLTGVSLINLRRVDEAFAVFDSIAARLKGSVSKHKRPLYAKALVNRGIALRTMGRLAEAADAYGDVIQKFRTQPEIEIKEQVARALINQGVLFSSEGKYNEAIATYEQLISLGKSTDNPFVSELVAKAYVNKGISLGEVQRVTDELASYNAAISRFQETSEVEVARQVAKALFNKGELLTRENRRADARAAYNEICLKYRDSQDSRLQVQVAKALNNLGILAGQDDDAAAAITAFDDVIALCSAASDEEVRSQLAWAHINKAYALGCMGKIKEEIALYDFVIDCFLSPAQVFDHHIAKAMLYKSLTYKDQGLSDEAEAGLKELVARYKASFDSSVLALVKEAEENLIDRPTCLID